MNILIVDNNDSFTYNILELLRKNVVAKINVLRYDEIEISQIADFDKIIISPGPGLPADFPEVIEVNRDASDTTIWIRVSPPDSDKILESIWVHVNPLQKTVLGYLFLDSSGETLAEIVYGEQQERSDGCKLRDAVRITGLPWGAELEIQLKSINTSNTYSKKDFSLPVPPGYTTQLHH